MKKNIKPSSLSDGRLACKVMGVILNTTLSHFLINLKDLQEKSRKNRVVIPRKILYALAYKFTTLPLVDIGYYGGGQDHAEVLHLLMLHKYQLSQGFSIDDSYVIVWHEIIEKITPKLRDLGVPPEGVTRECNGYCYYPEWSKAARIDKMEKEEEKKEIKKRWEEYNRKGKKNLPHPNFKNVA